MPSLSLYNLVISGVFSPDTTWLFDIAATLFSIIPTVRLTSFNVLYRNSGFLFICSSQLFKYCAFSFLAYIIHSGFISGYQNRYGDNLKPPTNVYHRMTAWCRVIILSEALISACSGLIITSIFMERIWLISPITESDSGWFQIIPLVRQRVSSRLATKLQGVDGVGKSWTL